MRRGEGGALRRFFLRWAPLSFLRWTRPSPQELGRAGERLAARHLRRAGWRVLASRLRTPAAEIDLVIERRGVTACVEVKTGAFDVGLDAAGPPRFPPRCHLGVRQLRRLLRAARFLERSTGSSRGRPRVDLVEVSVTRWPGGVRVQLEHHADLRRVPG